ncbi:MAG TPA: DUF4270 family protein, partial [Flavisolibacter sp.]|nr:DUF4270 family protein [Flavisolibacter sp.]
YIQSTPGSFATIRIPALDTFRNSTIHRAELIVSKLPAAEEETFAAQNRLFVDRKNKGPKDTAFTLYNDFRADFTGGLGFAQFGGNLQSDNTYRFTLTRHVQGIVTRREPNDTLRLYAPLRSTLYDRNLAQFISVPVVSPVAFGRVIVAGGNYPDPALRMRLRIIYSKL